jgi:hypothetical protein
MVRAVAPKVKHEAGALRVPSTGKQELLTLSPVLQPRILPDLEF